MIDICVNYEPISYNFSEISLQSPKEGQKKVDR